MKLNYINKIKANLSVYATKKTTDILDGGYISVYKGKSMNFEDLREYVQGDNIKDIDWKASARTNKLLVKQFIAEKKHNVLFVLDTGKKMLADTEIGEPKALNALLSFGTVGYLVDKHGDNISSIYATQNGIKLNQFKAGLYNLEQNIINYEKAIPNGGTKSVNELLDYVLRFIKKRMIIFVITDLDGLNTITTNTLKRLALRHDTMFINISDACMTDSNSYDWDENNYIPEIFLHDKKLVQIEKETKDKLYKKVERNLKKYKMMMTTISSTKAISKSIIELLERYRNANYS